MNDKEFAEITEALLKTIARNDELTEQLASALGLELDEFEDYLDRVEFPVVGAKNKHDV
ncbi:MAG TPA: hypothetical protein PKX15_03390 [Bacteroidales bacterium]|nr:hypothetical protein [Bacteroidales bacterium]